MHKFKSFDRVVFACNSLGPQALAAQGDMVTGLFALPRFAQSLGESTQM